MRCVPLQHRIAVEESRYPISLGCFGATLDARPKAGLGEWLFERFEERPQTEDARPRAYPDRACPAYRG